MSLNLNAVLIRLLLATVVSGVIGWDREERNHPAGIRTHILVCLGACILALCQIAICEQTLGVAKEYPQFLRVITANPARLIAQIVSGIGFLGAGTIVVTKHFVTGLTTAASLWVTAGIGIVIGMGYYEIAIPGSILVVLVLILLNRILKAKKIHQIEIKYYHRVDTNKFLRNYFRKKHVMIDHYTFRIDKKDSTEGEGRVYTSIYTVTLPKDLPYSQMLDQLSDNSNIVQINSLEV